MLSLAVCLQEWITRIINSHCLQFYIYFRNSCWCSCSLGPGFWGTETRELDPMAIYNAMIIVIVHGFPLREAFKKVIFITLGSDTSPLIVRKIFFNFLDRRPFFSIFWKCFFCPEKRWKHFEKCSKITKLSSCLHHSPCRLHCMLCWLVHPSKVNKSLDVAFFMLGKKYFLSSSLYLSTILITIMSSFNMI